jgi:hypothetical protein
LFGMLRLMSCKKQITPQVQFIEYRNVVIS